MTTSSNGEKKNSMEKLEPIDEHILVVLGGVAGSGFCRSRLGNEYVEKYKL